MSSAARTAKVRPSRPAAERPERRGRPAGSPVFLPTASGRRLALAGILAAALLLRVLRLTEMFPILVDEAIYLRWVQIIRDQGQWLISLLDGKPPLSYWILALPRFVSSADPLFEARLLSALAGVAACWGVFAVARRVAATDDAADGERAGLAAAALYAVLPWAVLYDRLAYTEAWVNLAGVGIALASLVAFERPRGGWLREAAPGLALGLGLFTKQTALLFALVPAAAACYFARRRGEGLAAVAPRLAATYALAAVFIAANFLLTPEAPKLETHDAVLHHTGFFADPAELLKNPFVAARSNGPKLASYVGAYLTWPLAAAAVVAAVALGRRGSFALWLLAAGSLAPLAAEVFLLELMFPTRYPFPLMWPWVAAAAVGAEAFARTRFGGSPRAFAGLAAALALWPLANSAGAIADPARGLHRADVEGFLGDHAHVGYGIREAVAWLEDEARRNGPFVLLADPIWGPPSDALFPYLHGRLGIQVYEAWWTQLAPDHPILPTGSAELLRSHYERVSAGSLDFARLPRVFYVTDTHYYPREAVRIRQPNAQLVASFPKLAGHSIDVYRLK